MKKITIIIATLVLIFLIYIVTLFISPKKQKLQNLVDTYLSEHRVDKYISTVAMTVQCADNKGQMILDSVYAGTLGHGDNPIEQKKTENDDAFQIGSITKSFISVVLLQLRNEPKYQFNLNDTVGKWFPEEKYKNWHAIKIRQLLNMTSGIPNDSLNLQFNNFYVQNPYHSFSLKEILDYENEKPLNFTPGTKFEYSNTNYTLSALLIERLTGNPVEQEVTRRVIDKLQLKHTAFPRNFAKDVYPYQKLVHGYWFVNNPTILENLGAKDFILLPNKTDTTNFNLSESNAAGAIISTTNDINIYVHALFTPGQLLSASQIEELKTNEPGIVMEDNEKNIAYFGLGIIKMHDKASNENFYTYTGSMLGFRFSYFYYPDRNLNIVFAINSGPLLQQDTFIQQKVIPEIYFEKLKN